MTDPDQEQLDQLDRGIVRLLIGKDRIVIFVWLIKLAVNIALQIAGKAKALELLSDTINSQFTESTREHNTP